MSTRFTETEVEVTSTSKLATQTGSTRGHVTPTTLLAWLQSRVEATWANISGKPTEFPPTTHAASHATGGADALTPAAIGAETPDGAQAKATAAANASIPKLLTDKPTLVDGDKLALLDSADTSAPKSGLLSSLWTYIRGKLGSSYLAPQTLVSGAAITIDGSLGTQMRLTLGHNAILSAPTNISDGQSFYIAGFQDGIGSRSLGANAVFIVRAGTLASIAALTAGARFDIAGTRVGANYRIWITT